MKTLLFAWAIFLGLLTGCTYTVADGDDVMSKDNIGMKNGWSAGGTIHSGQGDGVGLQANFAANPLQPAGYYTVQVSVNPPDDGVFLGEVTLSWSVEGQTIERRVSLGNGVTVSGTGQGVKVIVKDTTPNLGSPTLKPYFVSIQVAPGTRPDVEKPPMLFAEALIVAEGTPSTPIDIPRDAGAISVCTPFAEDASSGGGLTGIIVQQQLIAGPTLVVQKQYLLGGAGDNLWLPIVGDAQQVVIVAKGAAGSKAFVTVLFGIDG
jgi:hypothetical protein